MDSVDPNNILSEHLNGYSLHLNRHRKGNLVMNLIQKIRKITQKKFSQKLATKCKTQSRALPQKFAFNWVSNNNCEGKLHASGPLLEADYDNKATNLQDIGNQMNVLK